MTLMTLMKQKEPKEPKRRIALIMNVLFYFCGLCIGCLLYTSPSPRDRG